MSGMRIAAMLLLLLIAPPGHTQDSRLDFDVWLEDRRIGHYRVDIVHTGAMTEVSIDTDIVWTFLSVPVYRYTHRNAERWQDDCLLALESETSDNGERNFVQASAQQDTFNLTSHQGVRQLEGCVRSFAYWDPRLLSSERLLNSQTGEYTPITVTPLVGSPPQIDGAESAVTGYRLNLPDTSIDLWYSEEMEWLVLETRVRGGRMLRYVKTERSV